MTARAWVPLLVTFLVFSVSMSSCDPPPNSISLTVRDEVTGDSIEGVEVGFELSSVRTDVSYTDVDGVAWTITRGDPPDPMKVTLRKEGYAEKVMYLSMQSGRVEFDDGRFSVEETVYLTPLAP